MHKRRHPLFQTRKSYTSKASFLDKDPVPVWSRMIRRSIALVANELRVVCTKVKQEHVSMLILMVR